MTPTTDACDFDTITREELPQAQRLAQFIALGFNPHRVLDVGCGPAIYVHELKKLGVDAWGTDNDARSMQYHSVFPADVTVEKPHNKWDFVLSLEVGEHIPEEGADAYVDYLVACDAPHILFSAAKPGQGGNGHINCQPKEYWVAKLQARGYVVNAQATATFLRWLGEGYHMGWLAQNGVIFSKPDLVRSNPRLHMIGLFHTEPTNAHSHCAFTGKVLRFPRMMAAQGWETTLYHNGASEAGATEEVRILSTEELTLLRRCYLRAVREMPYPVKASATQRDTHFRAIIDYSNRLAAKRAVGVADQAFEGDTAVLGSPHYNAFSKKLREELAARVQPGDIICHPFGKSHADLRAIFPFAAHVETGIGYPDAEWGATRIYETSAWMHYHLGRANRNGTDYDFVVPNYFDLSEWPVDARKENTGYILYFGRVIESKGMAIVRALADALGEEILIVGQGDLGPYAHPNLRKLPPVKGLERAALLAGARCLLMPTRFTEPFGGAGVEGMLCGTPLISSDYGAFQETNMQGVTGYRCHVLGDWIAAVAAVKTLDRAKVAEIARARYSLATCGKRYAQIFQMVTDRIAGAGWMTAQDRFLANS